MRTTLNIPDDLISEVQKISKEKSKTKAIVTAMEAYVRDKKMTALRALRGKMPLEYDWQRHPLDNNFSVMTVDEHFRSIPGLGIDPMAQA